MTIRKRYVPMPPYPSSTHTSRYSEFDDLRQSLAATFPNAGQAMPALPPKSVICRFPVYSHKVQSLTLLDKFRSNFLERRRVGLEYFLKSVHAVFVFATTLTPLVVYC